MEKVLILAGWGSQRKEGTPSAEYLAAAAALYGWFEPSAATVDVQGVSQAELVSVLEAQGARYGRIEILGIGLTANLERLGQALKSLAAGGVVTRWWSRMAMPEEAAAALGRAGAAFGEVAVANRETLFDVVDTVLGADGLKDEDRARLRGVAKADPRDLKELADLSKVKLADIWFGLFQAAGFAHRDARDEAAYGEVVKALWRNEVVRPALSTRFQSLMDAYRAGYMSEIVGESPSTRALRLRLEQAARYENANVLILGETGTGKQVAAQRIHDHSARKNRRFVHHNCAYAGNDDMLLDRLFGHVKGAYTGADRETTGLFDDANGGTLFLDEIGEAKASVQAMLLTVLETGSFVRVGGSEEKRVAVDVRLVCATNRNLQEMVLKGEFRLDLYERLCDFPVRLVPLRDRKEDIAQLVFHYWPQMTGRRPLKKQVADLMDYDYPGNVRELISLLKRGWALCPAGEGGRKNPSAVDFARLLDEHRAFNRILIDGLRNGRMVEAGSGPAAPVPAEGGLSASAPDVLPAPAAMPSLVDLPADLWPDSAEAVESLHARKVYEKKGGRLAEAAAAAGLCVNTFKKRMKAALGLLAAAFPLLAAGTESAPASGETWRVAEWAFEASRDYAPGGGDDVKLDVAFTERATGRTLVRPGFWDGARTFRVRFAPPAAGEWTWRTSCADDAALTGRVGTFAAVPYGGPLALYRRGFVNVRPGDKHFTHADGTPFFYLGDTHWGLYTEELDEAGPHAGDVKTDSHLGHIVRRRVEQGFTVLQSEPIGARFDVRDGHVDAADIPGFRDADRYYRLIADAGLVHANAEFFFASQMNAALATNAVALARLSRYWVARFGAFPVMWTLAQEVDNSFYHERGDQRVYSCTNNPWVTVAECLHACDAYGHPLSGHQENTWHTTVTGAGTSAPTRDGNGRSVFADAAVAKRTGHSWWAVQWSPPLKGNAQADIAKDYWNDPRPAVNYEGRYCCLWTKDFGARAQGWISLLSGMCGYGYGAIDIWLYKSTYDTKKDSHDGVDRITVADKLLPWSKAVEFESAHQCGHMRRFFERIDWWRLKPDFADGVRFRPEPGALYTCAADGDRLAVAYFHGASTATGTLRGLKPEGGYALEWFNPRTGETASAASVWATAAGELRLPAKPDDKDWTVLITRR